MSLKVVLFVLTIAAQFSLTAFAEPANCAKKLEILQQIQAKREILESKMTALKSLFDAEVTEVERKNLKAACEDNSRANAALAEQNRKQNGMTIKELSRENLKRVSDKVFETQDELRRVVIATISSHPKLFSELMVGPRLAKYLKTQTRPDQYSSVSFSTLYVHLDLAPQLPGMGNTLEMYRGFDVCRPQDHSNPWNDYQLDPEDRSIMGIGGGLSDYAFAELHLPKSCWTSGKGPTAGTEVFLEEGHDDTVAIIRDHSIFQSRPSSTGIQQQTDAQKMQ